MQARTSSRSKQEYPSKIVTMSSPAESMSSTCSTASQWPSNDGLASEDAGVQSGPIEPIGGVHTDGPNLHHLTQEATTHSALAQRQRRCRTYFGPIEPTPRGPSPNRNRAEPTSNDQWLSLWSPNGLELPPSLDCAFEIAMVRLADPIRPSLQRAPNQNGWGIFGVRPNQSPLARQDLESA